MGERKGQNHYYPPDFDPVKHKNLNNYHGTHALRERARKLDQGILIIRFEMPYNIWCDGCKAHIAMGVRYNAQKSKTGMYYTTPIHHFRMKCHLCDQHFEIETDPGNMDYKILSGARRKEQRWSMADNEQIVTEEKSDIKKLSADPMFKLEHDTIDKTKVQKIMPTLRELESVQSQWKDDFDLNSLMRGHLRSEKKVIQQQKDSDKKFLDKWNINIELTRENEQDIKLASLYKFNSLETEKNGEELSEEARKKKRKSINLESIFDNKKKHRTLSVPVENHKNSKQLQINGLKTKVNKSVQEKKLINNSLDDSIFFNIKNPDNVKKNNKLNNLVVKKLPNSKEISTEDNNVSCLVSAYSSDDTDGD